MDVRSIMHYKNRDVVVLHIKQVSLKYPNLIPSVNSFGFSNRPHMDLANLNGTIPVHYGNAEYNIPIQIWLLDTYPLHAPICYVKPGHNMRIQPSKAVDPQGKVYLPYLHDWNHNESNLVMLVETLIVAFRENMPVFEVPPRPTSKPVSNVQTPYPLYPSFYMPPTATTSDYQRPSMGYPTFPVSAAPPYPMNATPPYPINATPPYPVNPVTPYPVSAYPGMPQAVPQAETGTITGEHIRASLLSAVEDKFRHSMKEHVAQWTAELETLEKIQSELTQGKKRLNDLTASLEKEQSEWEKILTTLRDKDAELDGALLNITNQGELDVDEAVVTTAPIFKQLLTAFAEEAATEDAIYYLGEALRRGVIDLDIFLKHVRSLSRKQFMLRALMNKCRNKAGLA